MRGLIFEMKKRWVFIIVMAAALFLASFVVPMFVQWSEMNCRHQEINIKTGQARESRYLWFIKISEKITDTPLSLALQGETVEVADIKPWHRVNTFSPGVRHSPHYRFHGAFAQVKSVEMITSRLEFTQERKRETAKSILIAWQISGRDYGAEEYIQNLKKN